MHFCFLTVNITLYLNTCLGSINYRILNANICTHTTTSVTGGNKKFFQALQTISYIQKNRVMNNFTHLEHLIHPLLIRKIARWNILYVRTRMWRHASPDSHMYKCESSEFDMNVFSESFIFHQPAQNILLLIPWPWNFTTVIIPPRLSTGITIVMACFRHRCLCSTQEHWNVIYPPISIYEIFFLWTSTAVLTSKVRQLHQSLPSLV